MSTDRFTHHRCGIVTAFAVCALLSAAGACSSSVVPVAEEVEQPADEHPAEEQIGEEVEEADLQHLEKAQEHQDDRYDDPEKYAERWNDPARDEWQQPQAIIDAMAIEEGMTVADLGAGTGYFIPLLAEAVGDEGTVLAVDIEPSMLDYIENMARESGLKNVETLLASGDDSGLSERSVDRILTVNTWHHIANRGEYAAHLRERLRDNGSVWVVDYDEAAPVGPPQDHRLAPETVIDELEAGGFEVELRELELERQFMVVATSLSPPD